MTWGYNYDPHIWPAVIAVGLTGLLSIYGWSRRYLPGVTLFAIACFFAALWAAGTALEAAAVSFSVKTFWIKFQTVWQWLAAAFMPAFIVVYAGLGKWFKRRNVILLTIPFLIGLFFIFTNFHGSIWSGFQSGEFMIRQPGPLNRLFIGFANLLGLVSVGILVWLAIRSPRHHTPALIMIVGQLAGRGAYLYNSYTNAIDPAAAILVMVCFWFSAYAIAVYRFHVLDPVPLAKTAVLDQMHEGVIVLDNDGRIASTNSTAEHILGKSAANLRGKPAGNFLPFSPEVFKNPSMPGASLGEIKLGQGPVARHYRLNLTQLKDNTGILLGNLLLLHDVTVEKKALEQLMQQQRVVATLEERERLARELHDGIGQVIGYMGMQAETARKLVTDGDKEKADALLGRLTEVARDAHADVRGDIFSLKTGQPGNWSFIAALRQYLARFQDNYGIRTEVALGDVSEESILPEAGVQLMRVLQEALTNSRKHGKAKNIHVSATRKDGHLVLSIADDGAGFDTGATGEDGHFGLKFMAERMNQIGGYMEVKSKINEGTTVSLIAPVNGAIS